MIELKKVIRKMFLTFICFYLGFSFLLLDINPCNWSEEFRFFVFFTTIIRGVLFMINKEFNPKMNG